MLDKPIGLFYCYGARRNRIFDNKRMFQFSKEE